MHNYAPMQRNGGKGPADWYRDHEVHRQEHDWRAQATAPFLVNNQISRTANADGQESPELEFGSLGTCCFAFNELPHHAAAAPPISDAKSEVLRAPGIFQVHHVVRTYSSCGARRRAAPERQFLSSWSASAARRWLALQLRPQTRGPLAVQWEVGSRGRAQ
jgi:hypothetical protein